MSGLFAICMNLFLRARMEKEIDIVLEIKLARRSRPEFIGSVSDQLVVNSYNFLLERVMESDSVQSKATVLTQA